MDLQSCSPGRLSAQQDWTISPAIFAANLLCRMASVRPEASRMIIRARGKTAVFGIEDEYGWEPLLRLSNPSDACNVMSLDIRSKSRWQPSFYRGTPEQLAEPLTGEIHFTWWSWVQELGPSETSDHGH